MRCLQANHISDSVGVACGNRYDLLQAPEGIEIDQRVKNNQAATQNDSALSQELRSQEKREW